VIFVAGICNWPLTKTETFLFAVGVLARVNLVLDPFSYPMYSLKTEFAADKTIEPLDCVVAVMLPFAKI
jgi:arginine exporter protein ArgO